MRKIKVGIYIKIIGDNCHHGLENGTIRQIEELVEVNNRSNYGPLPRVKGNSAYDISTVYLLPDDFVLYNRKKKLHNLN